MLRFSFILGFIIIAQSAICQINGLSATKFVSFSYSSLAAKTIEFEPNYAYARFNGNWDQNGTLITSDTSYLNTSLSWRFTYGITDRLEVGMFTNDDFSFVNWAAKMGIYDNKKHQLGIMVGLNTLLGNRAIAPNDPETDTYGLGLIYTWEINNIHSLDVNIQYGSAVGNEQTVSPTFYYSLDYARYIKENYLVALAASYQHADPAKQGVKLLMLTPGVSIEHSERFQIALNGSYNITGANTNNGIGYNIALTICLD